MATSVSLHSQISTLIKFVTGHEPTENLSTAPTSMKQDEKLALMARLLYRKTASMLLESLEKLTSENKQLLRYEVELRIDALAVKQ